MTGLTPFYAGMWLFEEPLFFNSFIETHTLSSASQRSALREAGHVKVGHLLRLTESTVTNLGPMANIRSSRLLARIVQEVCVSLSETQRALVKNRTHSEQWIEEGEYRFLSLTVSAAVGE